MKSTKNAHSFRFFRAGGLDQVRLDTGADILAVPRLDQKLWLALSCPVKGMEFDERTLQLLDADSDGRVRAPEIIRAIEFVADCIKNPDELTKHASELPLSSIKDSTERGALLLASAQRALAGLGKGDAKSISIDDVNQTGKIFAGMKFNGDGNIHGDCVGDPDAREVFGEVIDCLGAEVDAAGCDGITQAKVDQFFAALSAFDEWSKVSEGEAKATIFPAGDETAAAAAAIEGVRAKIDDFFGRVRLAGFDPRALAALNRKEEEYLQIAANDMSITAAEVSNFPLAMVEAGRDLPLKTGVNPAWTAAMAAFRDKTVAPLLPLKKGQDSISEEEWATLQAKLAPFVAWQGSKKGGEVEKLGLDRVRAILAGNSKENLSKLIAKDKAADAEMQAIGDVERLCRYYRDLHPLLNNFVSFTDFYRREKAIFQAGELYLDSRRCDLCVKVDSPDSHAGLAVLSKAYLAYCKCTRPSTGETMFIAAAFTNGDSDELMVGRNGLFYDRAGRDWDATIVKVLDNPISVRQAFWGPYKKALRWIEETVAKKAAAADTAATGKLTSVASDLGDAAASGKAGEKKKFDVGTVAALGVGVGAITAALGALLESFFGLGKWMPLGIVGLILLISGPSMLIAFLKLRQRSLGPILEGNGWAINGRVRLNIPLGGAMTALPTLPEGSERSLVDPYAVQTHRMRNFFITLAVLVALAVGLDLSGKVDVRGHLRSLYQAIEAKVKGEEAPADGAAEDAGTDADKPADEGAPVEEDK